MIKFLQHITSKLRMPVWWYHIVPPILSVVYAIIWISEIPLNKIIFPLVLFAVSMIGSAAFGYWLNDWTDIKTDALVGKKNQAAVFTKTERYLIAFALITLGCLPWLFLPPKPIAWIALGLLFISFFLYSIPPLRCKSRSIWGVLCDVHYGHVLPVILALATFSDSQITISWNIIISLLILVYIKGFRNIIEHQITDRKNDRKSGIRTFVIALQPLRAARLLSFVLIPLELIMIAIFLLQWHIPLFTTYVFFLILYLFLLKRWGVFRVPLKQRWFRFWYVANDYYEGWLPLSILILASVEHWQYLILLIVHLVLFSRNLKWFAWLSIELSAMITIRHAPAQNLTE